VRWRWRKKLEKITNNDENATKLSVETAIRVR